MDGITANGIEKFQVHRAPGHVSCGRCGKLIPAGWLIAWHSHANERNPRFCWGCFQEYILASGQGGMMDVWHKD